MPTHLFIGIDGSGAGSGLRYEPASCPASLCDPRATHVVRLANRFRPVATVNYARSAGGTEVAGTGTNGGPTNGAPRDGVGDVIDPGLPVYPSTASRYAAAPEPDGQVFLAGHGPGGAEAIEAAWDLRDRGISVDALFLFDAVAHRAHRQARASTVPDNVRACYHARGAFPVAPGFDVVGTRAAVGVHLVERVFSGSHAALGGLEDGDAARAAWDWMAGHASQEVSGALGG